MGPNYDLLFMFVMLVAYSYTLVHGHILLARVDRKAGIGRNASGEIKKSAIVAVKLKFNGPELKKAMFLLQLNQVVTYLFFVFLVFDLLIRLDIPGMDLSFF